MEHISEVLSLLDLAQRNDDVFVGEHPDTEQQRNEELAALEREYPRAVIDAAGRSAR